MHKRACILPSALQHRLKALCDTLVVSYVSPACTDPDSAGWDRNGALSGITLIWRGGAHGLNEGVGGMARMEGVGGMA